MRFFALLAFIGLFGCGPMGHTPGIRLGGTEVPSPENFAFVQEGPDEIQLASQGMLLPHVVNLWIVADDKAMYVAGTPERGWVKRLEARPDDVRVRVGDAVYVLSSRLLENEASRQRVFSLFLEKYGAESVNASVGATATADDFESIFKLTPRV